MISKVKTKWNSIPITVKVSISYTICSILQKCISLITLPLFTRLLTTEQYGQLTIYQSWSGVIAIFVTLNLSAGSFSTAMVKFKDKREEYISSIQGICLLLSLVFLVIYLPLNSFWNKLFHLPTFLIIIMLVEIVAQTGLQLWAGKKRFEFKYKSIIAVTLATSVAAPILAYILVTNTGEKGIARIIGYAIIGIVVYGVIFVRNIIQGKKLFNKEFWRYAFRFNVPLLAYYISQVIFNQSDRIMIEHLTGASDAAMYGVAYNFAMILTFVLSAINNSYLPWYYEKIQAGKQEDNKRISSVIAIIMALLLLFVIWFAPEIIRIMAGKNYMSAIPVVAPISISLLLLFYSQLFINVEFYYEEKKLLVFASIGAAVVNIVLNYWLIPIFGFVVAAYTTLFSYILFALCNYIAMKVVLKKRNIADNALSYKALIIIFVAFVAASYLGVVLYNLLLVRITVTVIVLLIAIIFRERLLGIFKEMKKS